MTLAQYQKYKQAEHYFESIGNITTEDWFKGQADPEHFFSRAQLFLKIIGHPDRAYKIIHVAGTAGKGSTVNHIANILQTAGYKVGVHVSPYVSAATEKIQINGKFISTADFIELVEELKPAIEKLYQQFDVPSYFECWIMAALLYFKKQQVDYVVLETGCGGRYDATNAVLQTEYSVITNIGLDHEFMLGDTVEKIAYQKAGIIRERGRVITAAVQPSVIKIIQNVCQEKNANLTILTNQTEPNQALAAQVCQDLGIDNRWIINGLKKLRLPARFEIMQKKPLIILDGAHNQDKISYLAARLPQIIPNLATRKIHLICALADKKNPPQVFNALKPMASRVYATRFTNAFRKAHSPTVLAQVFKPQPAAIYLDPQQALRAALTAAKPRDVILITGSFFLCSDLRTNWISEQHQLQTRQSF